MQRLLMSCYSLHRIVCRSAARHGAGYVGDGVREGREALSPHDQGQPHKGPETQAHHLPQMLPGKVRLLAADLDACSVFSCVVFCGMSA